MQAKKNPVRTAALLLAGALLAGSAVAAPGDSGAPGNGPADAQASGQSPTQAKAKARARNKLPRVRHSPVYSSGETPAQRERRLLRECKGLPNAGACLGYARR
jgi:hypothetical protein